MIKSQGAEAERVGYLLLSCTRRSGDPGYRHAGQMRCQGKPERGRAGARELPGAAGGLGPAPVTYTASLGVIRADKQERGNGLWSCADTRQTHLLL